MSTHASVLTAATPVARLLWSRRVVLPMVGILSLAGILGWVGAMIRFSRVTPAPGDPMFAPLVAASALVMLPAAVGLLAGDAIQQLARRASLRLLPALQGRLIVALGVLALLTCVPIAICTVPFREELSLVTALGPAALGFSLGAFFPGRARKGPAWLVAFALPALADPICRLAAHPLATVALLSLCAAALQFELRRLLRPGAYAGPGLTWLQPFAGPQARREADRAARQGKAEVSPPERIVDGRGWFAAHRFEHRSITHSILAPAGTVKFVAVCFAVSMFTPVIQGLDADGPGFQGLFATIVEAFVGPFDEVTRLGASAASTVVVVIWVASAILAAMAGAPLLGNLLYPISRHAQAELAAKIARRTSLLAFATLLTVGGLAGAVLLETLGGRWPRALPTFAWVALVGLATAPWVQVLWLALARRLRRSQNWRSWGVFFAGLALPVVVVSVAFEAWANKAGRPLTAPWILGYVVILVTGWLAQTPLLKRHFSRCDLAG